MERVRAELAALLADADGLVDAAVSGRLETRADASRHEGGFRRIVEGVNATLDAALRPIEEAARALDALARRDLRARVAGDFQGDHARIKEALNATAAALEQSFGEVAAAVAEASQAAAQIASSSQAVAAGASEQAHSLSETSGSLGVLAETVSTFQVGEAKGAGTAGGARRGSALRLQASGEARRAEA